MRKSELYKNLTNCEYTAKVCDEVVDTKKLLKTAKTDNRKIAIKCALELEKAIQENRIDNRKGGFCEVAHFLAMFKTIPAGKEGVLFDKVTYQTLSIRESEWIAVKTILSMPFGKARTNLEIISKRKDGKGGFSVIPFRDIDFTNDYEIEAAKLRITIKPLQGVDTNTGIKYQDNNK